MPGLNGASIKIPVAALVFAATMEVFRRYLRRPKERDVTVLPVDATIGSRGMAALPPPLSYLSSFFMCLQDPCDPRDNPTGYIALCIAENKLVTDLIAERLMQPGTATAAFSDSEVYCYGSFLGLPVARSAIAYFVAKKFLFPGNQTIAPEEALQHISPDHIALGAGGAALLNYLFYILGEKGDCCLIPAPYYAAFESDMSAIAGCKPFAVHVANPAKGPTPGELDLAFIQAQSKGTRVRFLLLTNPNNPLGVIYSPDVVRSAVAWARKRGLHTIMDEIYALSTHDKNNRKFESIIRILDNQLGNDVHFLWALSKDFGASGFRVGTLYTQNEQLLRALANLNIFSGVSHPIQMIAAEVLTDDHFVDRFLDTSRERLSKSYAICAGKLEEMVIPYIHAEAAIFLYVDFSSLLPKMDSDGEAMLSDLMTTHARIVLTPGDSQRDSRPGWFRICYASVSPEVLGIAMERLSRLVAKVRKMDWSDLHATSLDSVLVTVR
jgi:aspartate/methionine/tyrosine aminotransferase